MTYKRMCANWNHSDDMIFFRRKHTGDAPEKMKPPLAPVWPMFLLGGFLLILGAGSIATAANGAVALGGVILAGIGLGLLSWFTLLLTGGRRD